MSPTSSNRSSRNTSTIKETIVEEVDQEKNDLLAERKRLHDLEIVLRKSISDLREELRNEEGLLNSTAKALEDNLDKLDNHGRING